MSLLNMSGSSQFGFKGQTPPSLKVSPNPPGSFHDTYSVDGQPIIKVSGANSYYSKPQPSHLSLGNITPTQYIKNLPK